MGRIGVVLHIVCILFMAESLGVSAETGSDISVSLYQGGRIAVVTPTYDDTKATHISRLVPLFKEFGYHCTFYVNSARIGPNKATTWDQWKVVAEAGFEVGNHSKSHWLKKGEPAWTRDQIIGGYEEILKHTGVKPLTFAFPGGSENAATLKIFNESAHIDYRHRSHKKKGDRLWVGEKKQVAAAMPGFIDRVINHEETWNKSKLSWMITVMHDITDEKEQAVRAMLSYIKQNDDKVWCTSYATATCYEKEREESQLTLIHRENGTLTFVLQNELNADIYNVPLTVQIPVESAGDRVQAKRNGKSIRAVVKNGYILVDCVPHKEPVQVSW